jgi:hypothetical protein
VTARHTRRRAALAIVMGALLVTTACTASAVTASGRASQATLDLPTEPWWGGPAAYAPWGNAVASGWAEPEFFPIAVFFGKPEHAERLAALGVNTYMGAERDGSPLSEITGAGVSVLAQPEWTDAEVGDDPGVVGWHVSDECDMGLGGCDSADGEEGSLAIQRTYVESLRAKDDDRFLQANFGNGVLGSFWSPTTMPAHVALMDVTSVDKYAWTSPHVQGLLSDSPFWPSGRDPRSAFAYGWQQDRMESFGDVDAPRPHWVLVETARPLLTEEGATTITLTEIRAAVWNALIHGAAGITYFQHNNDDTCGVYSLVECGSDLAEGVGAINAEITTLAPVLNSPSYRWELGPGIDGTVKAHDGFAYVFAMTDGSSGSRTLRLPPGVDGEVDVLGENRVLVPTTEGTVSDEFASESTVHLYRVQIGARR